MPQSIRFDRLAFWNGPERTTVPLLRNGKPPGNRLRVALTGSTISPGIFETVALVGRDRALTRIDRALDLLPGINGFLRQDRDERTARAETLRHLASLAGGEVTS